MRFKYFKANFQTPIEEAKRQYRKLALKYHPDLGGSEEAMKAVNDEWAWLMKHNCNIHETASGSVYTDERQDAPDEVTERFAAIISELITYEGVGIEICGSFIWLSGNTYERKEEIKDLGFRWSRKKRMWYLSPSRKRHRSNDWTMEEIRAKHGSLVVAEGMETSDIPRLMASNVAV